jgi:hypothetical protein
MSPAFSVARPGTLTSARSSGPLSATSTIYSGSVGRRVLGRPVLVSHPSESVHRPAKGVADASGRSLLRVRRRSVYGAALDEQAHEYDESYAHQEDGPPVIRYPLGDA